MGQVNRQLFAGGNKFHVLQRRAGAVAQGAQRNVQVQSRQRNLPCGQGFVDVAGIAVGRGVAQGLAKADGQLVAHDGGLERRQGDVKKLGQEGRNRTGRNALGQIDVHLQLELGQLHREIALLPGRHIDQVQQQRVLPTHGQLQPPVNGLCRAACGGGHRQLAQGIAVVVIGQRGVGQGQLEVELGPLQHVAGDVDGRGLDLDAQVQRTDAARLCLAGEHVQQRGVLPAGAHLEAHIPRLAGQQGGADGELLFDVRQLGVADVDDHGIGPVGRSAGIGAFDLHELVQVDGGDLDHARRQARVNERLERVWRVHHHLAAIAQLHRFAQHRDAHGRRLDDEVGGKKMQRVDFHIAKEHRGVEHRQQRLEAALQQRWQVDQVEQFGIGPTHERMYAPVVGAAAMIDRAQHLLEVIGRQHGVGEQQLQAQIGPGMAQQRA